MIKKILNIKLVLILILISLIILSSYIQSYSNKSHTIGNADTLIGAANLSKSEKNLIKIGGADTSYVFEVKNPKENYKNISCFIDLYEDGKLKNTFGKLTTKLQVSDKLKYISIALNKSNIDNTKREFILSIITNAGVSQFRSVAEVNSKLAEDSVVSDDQKVLEGQATCLAVFIQNEGNISILYPISNNMTELLKNKRVYIFKCMLVK